MTLAPPRSSPTDQADGLRRIFSGPSLRFIPIISNPFIAYGGVLIERLCSAMETMRLDTLLVDASERGSTPKELAGFDLSEGIEVLSPKVSYLAARGLPVRWVDSHGSTRRFLDALADAAPDVQVVLLHGSASEMVRLFGRGRDGVPRPCPVVLCDDRPEAMTHAYAALKVLAQRADWLAHDLLMCASPKSPRAGLVAQRLAQCADLFLGGVQRQQVCVPPDESASAVPSDELMALARAALESAAAHAVRPLADEGMRSALPAPQGAHVN